MKGRIHLFHNTIRNSFSYTTDIIKWKGNFSIFIERNISSLETEKQFLLVFVIAVLKMNTMILFLYNFFFKSCFIPHYDCACIYMKAIIKFCYYQTDISKMNFKTFQVLRRLLSRFIMELGNSTVWEYVQNI